VDPVSHLLFARLLAALRDERALAPGVVAATTIGGIAPDIDAVLMARGWDVYLASHEGGTHSLAGTLAVAVLTAAVVRWRVPSARWRPLIGGAWIGALSHVFFDLISSGLIQPFWPVSHFRLSAPIVAMAEPFVIVCLLVGAVCLYGWPRIPRVAAAVALVLMACGFAMKLTTRARAIDAYHGATAQAGQAVHTLIEARWASWHEWLFFDRDGHGVIRGWVVDGWSGTARLRFTVDDAAAEPFAQESQRLFATARNFALAHDYAFAAWHDREGGSVIFWSDARFCWTASENTDPQADVPHQDVRPPFGPLRCAMWFGGSLDHDGRPVEALVWLGGHLQRRRR
jgi:membrane-bound metal-dependent hydrolase YbcI (DUF457 family)